MRRYPSLQCRLGFLNGSGHLALALAAVLVAPASALAQAGAADGDGGFLSAVGGEPEPLEGSINAERPGFSTSPQPLPGGHLQFEGGYRFDHDGDVDQHTTPLGLVRAGLARNLELQVSWPGYTYTEANGDGFQDPNDMSVGLKTKLVDQKGAVPTVGVLGKLSLPTGGGAGTSDGVDPTVGGLWTYDLTESVGLFGTVLLSSPTGDDGRFFEVSNAVGAGFSLTDKLSSYVEYFGFYRDVRGPEHYVNGGLMYLLTPNVQLDINAGVGLNDRAGDVFAGAGIAWRW